MMKHYPEAGLLDFKKIFHPSGGAGADTAFLVNSILIRERYGSEWNLEDCLCNYKNIAFCICSGEIVELILAKRLIILLAFLLYLQY